MTLGSQNEHFLKLLKAHKGQQAALEKDLKAAGLAMRDMKVKLARCAKANDASSCQSLLVESVKLEKIAAALIDAIKNCAAKANEAADAAVKTGSSRATVQAVAVQAVADAAVGPGNQVVVESSTATITSSGDIVPTSQATIETAPVTTDPGNAEKDAAAAGADDSVLTSSEVPWVKLGIFAAALYGASRLLKKG